MRQMQCAKGHRTHVPRGNETACGRLFILRLYCFDGRTGTHCWAQLWLL